MDPIPNTQSRGPAGPVPRSLMARLDAWMGENPWCPRSVPFFVYLLFLQLILWCGDLDARIYPFLYTIQCAAVLYLLSRYRKLLPELTLSFHWLAIPVGVTVLVAWNLLGWWMAGEFGTRWEALMDGRLIGGMDYAQAQREAGRFAITQPHFFETFGDKHPTFAWVSLVLKLLGMSIVVPMFEELFIRSLMLRSLNRYRQTGIGLLQIMLDLPVFGDWLESTSVGQRASQHPPVAFGREFHANALGVLTVFGVCASTVVFMLSHARRDWPGTIVCGVAYCLLLAATRHKGLGPVIWAHGITNALLWVYTIGTDDWQFL